MSKATFTARLAELQPSQLWINSEKLAAVMAGRKRLLPSDLAPLPVKQICDSVILTDGHTRAVAAALSGIDAISVYWETDDDLDWEMYEECVQWCRDEGIRSVLDLKTRIVSPEDYQRLWHDRCDALRLTLARRRCQIFMAQSEPRLRMQLSLTGPLPVPDLACRCVTEEDTNALAELMLAAFRDTVDYNGETIADAQTAIWMVFSGMCGPFQPDCSFVYVENGTLQSASLITTIRLGEQAPAPLLAWAMTSPSAQRRGLASALILRSARALAAAGHTRLALWVTATNLPARRAYERLGFLPAD